MIKLIDNFCPDDYFIKLRNTIFHSSFPWNYNQSSILPATKDSIPQFTHNFFLPGNERGTYEMLLPLRDLIKAKIFIKIKSNLNYKTERIIETGEHTDVEDNRFTSAVFNLNDNDGYTRIGNEKIYSKANRIIIFPSNITHTGTTCTNTERRVIINFIFID